MNRRSIALCLVLIAAPIAAEPLRDLAAEGAVSNRDVLQAPMETAAYGYNERPVVDDPSAGEPEDQQEFARALAAKIGNGGRDAPIPCRTPDGARSCMAAAEQICWLLGLGEPMEFFASGGELHALRCDDGS